MTGAHVCLRDELCFNREGSYSCASCYPDIALVGGGANSSAPVNIKRRVPFTVQSTVTVDCDVAYSFLFNWSLYAMDDGLPSVKIPLPKNVETGGSELTLPKNVLPYGKVAIRLEVTVEETLSGLRVVTSAEQWVNVLSSALVADIAGGSAKSLARGSDIVLDGSFSTDPDAMVTDAADFTYNWTCVTEMGTSCDDLFSDGGTNQSYVISSEGVETSAGRLIVHLSVWFPDRSPGTTFQILEIFPVGSPSLYIRCFSNCNRKINPSEKLVLVAECTNCEENELVSYNWTLQEAPDGFGRSDLNWDTKSTTGRNLPDVVIKPEVFKALGDYTLRVKMTLLDGRHGFAEYSFVPNEPPAVGSCTVSPENGTAMVTEFIITCTGFSDSDEPLTYTFLFNTDAASGFTPLYTGTDPTTPSQLFPVGQESRGFVVRIRVEVSDSFGATSHVETSVKVVALPAEQSTAVASQLVVGENSPLTQLVREGDAKSLVQMSNSVTSVLNTVPTNASAETRRAATEAREAVVAALTTIKPTSVSSVNLVASALGSATSGGDDVSADAQVATARSLKNMGEFLQSLPPEELEITQVEKTSSVMFAAVVNVLASSSKASGQGIDSAEGNTTDTNNLAKAKEAVDGIIGVIDSLSELVISRKRPDAEPTVISQGPFKIALQRQSCRDTGPQIVRPTGQSDTWFRIPGFSTLFGQSCGQSISIENYETSLNPYFYANNSDKIKSPVASLKFRSDEGPVEVNDLQVPIDVMMPQKPGTVVVQTERGETTPTGQDVMTVHNFTITEGAGSVHVTVTPGVEGIPVRLFLGINSAPSRQAFRKATSVPSAVGSLYSIPLGNNSYLRPDPFQWLLSASDLGLTGSERLFLGVDHEPFTNDIDTNDDTVMWGDLSEALELGYGGVNFTLNYTLKIFTSTCLFFDNDQQLWSTEGCQVGSLTTTSLTHCLCDHLTAFGSDFQFFVAPNSLNILEALEGFTNIMENPSVVITIGVLFGLYLLIAIWARWEDKKDGLKVGATVLEGSSRGGHTYEVMVYTGTRANAGTSAEVFLVLRGELGQSVPYVLEDKTRITFKQGAVDTFVVTSAFHLGPIYAIHIWHNNIGTDPSWYLDQVIVTDVQDGDKHTFLCKSWLAVEEGDGKVDRVLYKASYDDLVRFGRLFSTKTSKDFRDEHLWFSVIGRPATSPFTRVQRISCCLSLLMCTMLTNIMFFGRGQTYLKPAPVYILGFQVQFPISWGEIMIGIQSALMVIPVNLLIVQFFRNCAVRPSRKISTVDTVSVSRRDPGGTPSPAMSFSRDEPAFARRSGVYSVSSPTEGEDARTTTDGGLTVVSVEEFDSPEDTVSSREEERYGALVMKGGLSVQVDQLAKNKKKKKCLLPWWCVFFAWLLVLGTCVVSAFFTMLYGFEYGREKAEAWVLTFLTSFVFDLAISQPIKIILLGLFFALLIKKPDSLEDDVPPTQLRDDEVFLGLQDKDAKHTSRKKRSKPTGPPGRGILAVAREQRFIELGLRDACSDFVFYTSYIILLLVIANGSRDSSMYHMNTHLHNKVVNPFARIKDSATFWEFVRDHVVSDVHDVRWYNGDRFHRAGFYPDTSSFLVGSPRLRQIRVKKDESCDVPAPLWRVLTDCDKPYSLLNTDVNSYDVGWTRLDNVTFDALTSLDNISYYQRPWIYQYASLSAAVPDSGEHGTYYGGGYLVELSNSSSADMELIDELQEMDWIDDNTRAVFIEIIVYNANANLFAVLTLLAEFTTLGKTYTQGEIMVVRLYPYTTVWGFVALGCHGLFLLITLYLTFREVRRILTLGTEYFKMFWRVVELVLSLLALAEIGVHLYTAYLILGFNKVRTQGDDSSGDRRYNKYKQAASWEKINTYILGWLVCVACLKMLYLCRFNKRIARGPKVTRKALKPLLSFIVVFSFLFMAFCMLGFLALGSRLSLYSTFIGTMQTLFSVMLGKMDYYSVESAGGVLGPLMLFCFVLFFPNVLVMMFLAIFDDAFQEVIEEEEISGKSENEKIKDYAVYLFKKFVLKNTDEEFFTVNQTHVTKIAETRDRPSAETVPKIHINGISRISVMDSTYEAMEMAETDDLVRPISSASSVSTIHC
ncbi:polycystin-1-like protein 2 [Branchiostoma floridae x Branchiostoma belcheri]